MDTNTDKPKTKSFPLRVLLTVTTGRLLTEPKDGGNGIGDLYEILGWMTNDSPFTHQLGRFAEECKPWLLTWFPELSPVESCLDALDGCIRAIGAKEGVEQWLSKLDLPTAYDVPRMRHVDHVPKDPLAELVELVDKSKIVQVILPPTAQP
jgi:hypothetical protein